MQATKNNKELKKHKIFEILTSIEKATWKVQTEALGF